MPNFLEQLVAEWYEYQGYFVRRNVLVGKRARGGHESELDVVAFSPDKKRLLHIEPSMDTHKWEVRERRLTNKFRAGKTYIRSLFAGFDELPQIEPIALFVYGSTKDHPIVGGGKSLHINELMAEIRASEAMAPLERKMIPEQFVILRALQFAAACWSTTRS
jgi:hypothetical protein